MVFVRPSADTLYVQWSAGLPHAGCGSRGGGATSWVRPPTLRAPSSFHGGPSSWRSREPSGSRREFVVVNSGYHRWLPCACCNADTCVDYVEVMPAIVVPRAERDHSGTSASFGCHRFEGIGVKVESVPLAALFA